MEIKEPSKMMRKQIIFNVSAEDHELIKCMATKNRMSMRVWIINAMAESIKKQQEE